MREILKLIQRKVFIAYAFLLAFVFKPRIRTRQAQAVLLLWGAVSLMCLVATK